VLQAAKHLLIRKRTLKVLPHLILCGWYLKVLRVSVNGEGDGVEEVLTNGYKWFIIII